MLMTQNCQQFRDDQLSQTEQETNQKREQDVGSSTPSVRNFPCRNES